jgi:hypothetical protein
MKRGSQNRIPALAMFFRNPMAVIHHTLRLQTAQQQHTWSYTVPLGRTGICCGIRRNAQLTNNNKQLIRDCNQLV